jgi:2-iminobutanoate/2-iminopropanoate deaminase
MAIEKINIPSLTRLPSFCHCVRAGDFVFVSGTVGTDPKTDKIVDGGIGGQTRQTLRNIEAMLREVGLTLNDMVKVDVFIRELTDFGEMNKAYIEVVGSDPPARITVGKADLVFGALVEMDCIAYVDGKNGI